MMIVLNFTDPTVDFAFAGDWHGDQNWAVHSIYYLSKKGVKRIYQLGDFGLWPGPKGKRYLLEIARALRETSIKLYVILGNHEDYDRVSTMKSDEDGWLKLSSDDYKDIYFASRGLTWIESGLKFAGLGGASSVDRLLRVEGVSWWPGEEITEADCNTLVANVRARGWERVDILLTHEAPAGITMISALGGRPAWLTEEVLYESHIQRVRLRDAVDTVIPKVVAHGHWHYLSRNEIQGVNFSGVDYSATVLGLSNEGSLDNFWIPTIDELWTLLG